MTQACRSEIAPERIRHFGEICQTGSCRYRAFAVRDRSSQLCLDCGANLFGKIVTPSGIENVIAQNAQRDLTYGQDSTLQIVISRLQDERADIFLKICV